MARYIPRMPRDDEAIPPELHLCCTSCGYELTGLVERRCPECGQSFAPRDTWLENEQSTWEYHFENVRPRGDYIRMGYLVFAALVFFGLSLKDFRALLALP